MVCLAIASEETKRRLCFGRHEALIHLCFGRDEAHNCAFPEEMKHRKHLSFGRDGVIHALSGRDEAWKHLCFGRDEAHVALFPEEMKHFENIYASEEIEHMLCSPEEMKHSFSEETKHTRMHAHMRSEETKHYDETFMPRNHTEYHIPEGMKLERNIYLFFEIEHVPFGRERSTLFFGRDEASRVLYLTFFVFSVSILDLYALSEKRPKHGKHLIFVAGGLSEERGKSKHALRKR